MNKFCLCLCMHGLEESRQTSVMMASATPGISRVPDRNVWYAGVAVR